MGTSNFSNSAEGSSAIIKRFFISRRILSIFFYQEFHLFLFLLWQWRSQNFRRGSAMKIIEKGLKSLSNVEIFQDLKYFDSSILEKGDWVTNYPLTPPFSTSNSSWKGQKSVSFVK